TFDDGQPKMCGPDGCGGSCGDCSDDSVCDGGDCVAIPVVVVVDESPDAVEPVDSVEPVDAAEPAPPDVVEEEPAIVEPNVAEPSVVGPVICPVGTVRERDICVREVEVGGGCSAGGTGMSGGGILLWLFAAIVLLRVKRAHWLVLVASVTLFGCVGSSEDETEQPGFDIAVTPDPGPPPVDLIEPDVPEVPDVPDVQPDLGPPIIDTHDAAEVEVEVAEPGPCGDKCPEGYCDELTLQCEFCEIKTDCPGHNRWCDDHRCVKTACVPGTKTCQDSETQQICNSVGQDWDFFKVCAAGTVCSKGACLEVVCSPGLGSCEGNTVTACLPDGTGFYSFDCLGGQTCAAGSCGSPKRNLVIIMDTSGSMNDEVQCTCGEGNCPKKAFPLCEVNECPRTRLGLAKRVLRDLLLDPAIQQMNVVLFHGPMAVDAIPNSCTVGFYSNIPIMTQDTDGHATTSGGWFDQSLYEILAAGFPTSADEQPLNTMWTWVDNVETTQPTDVSCITDDQCPGGYCHPFQGAKRCWYHDNPELRSEGASYLGRMLFYAGEYIRRHVRVQGRSCAESADCANINYQCIAGICQDPYRSCRSDSILMITDGEVTPPLSSWFEATTQAKRMRYGLCCESDADCFEGATCQEGRCANYPKTYAPEADESTTVDGPCRLASYDGDPFSVITHVVNLSASGDGLENNHQIADAGGGLFHHAPSAQSADILAAILAAIDAKANESQCMPEPIITE
ncbi:MAG: hypothetical protein ACI9OJ_001802, partial [Myxococcota bacterium]